jgi:hypothetical protein
MFLPYDSTLGFSRSMTACRIRLVRLSAAWAVGRKGAHHKNGGWEIQGEVAE